MSRSKRYRHNVAMIDRTETYSLREGVELLKRMQTVGFNETVELSCLLGIEPKQTNQTVRGSFALPHGTGQEIVVIAFCEGSMADEARDAGAEAVGSEELADRVEDGWTDFDVAVAHPSMMRYVGKLGRLLGPQGKMPSPKSGTVVEDVPRAVREFRAGKIEFRNDRGGNVHAPVGKLNFPSEKIIDNIEALVGHLKTQRPASAKGAFVRKAVISSTMSPGLKVSVG